MELEKQVPNALELYSNSSSLRLRSIKTFGVYLFMNSTTLTPGYYPACSGGVVKNEYLFEIISLNYNQAFNGSTLFIANLTQMIAAYFQSINDIYYLIYNFII
jgi:hypothetical protein